MNSKKAEADDPSRGTSGLILRRIILCWLSGVVPAGQVFEPAASPPSTG